MKTALLVLLLAAQPLTGKYVSYEKEFKNDSFDITVWMADTKYDERVDKTLELVKDFTDNKEYTEKYIIEVSPISTFVEDGVVAYATSPNTNDKTVLAKVFYKDGKLFTKMKTDKVSLVGTRTYKGSYYFNVCLGGMNDEEKRQIVKYLFDMMK